LLKKPINIILIVLIVSIPAIGEQSEKQLPRATILKSALIPGWGEHDYQSHSRGYLFNGIETTLWIFAGLAYTSAVQHENDLFYAASEYGQITNPHLKSDVFLDRVSKYDNMDEYNEQMLRNRQWDRVYSAEDGEYWEWESFDKRVDFFNIKTKRWQWRQRLTYTFGAIALNHLVSSMDALYLKRNQTSMQLIPEFGNGSSGMRLSISF